MSSLGRQCGNKEETELRHAGGLRRVVDLPIGEVRLDPREVRSDFGADLLSAEDQEKLEGPPCNTLTQLSDNLQRSSLNLLDVANALNRCLDDTHVGQVELEKELGHHWRGRRSTRLC